MSFKLMAQVMDMQIGNATRKLVLMKLADQANDKGECYPSYSSIADACETTKRTVMTHTKNLEKYGFLRIQKRWDKENQRNHSNVYHLTLGNGNKDIPLAERQGSENIALPQEPGEIDSLPGEIDSLPGEIDSPTPSEIISPEPINLEPINEPINEPKEIIDFWNSQVPVTNAVKYSTWSGKIKTRLKTFTVDEIKTAMTYILKTEWYQKNGEVLIKNAISSNEKCETAITKYQQKLQNTGNYNANNQSVNQANSQNNNTTNHFDNLRAEARAKYGNRDESGNLRTVS